MFNWEHKETSDEDLKAIAKDLYEGKIFSDRHIDKHTSTYSVFMSFALWDIYEKTEKEDPKLEADRLVSLELYPIEKRDEFINDIGLIYEYLSKATPTSINGYPTFISHNLLSKKDTIKMFEYYEKYEKLKKEIEEKY